MRQSRVIPIPALPDSVLKPLLFGSPICVAPATRWTYPGGEVGVRVTTTDWPGSGGAFRIHNSEDLMALLLGLQARHIDHRALAPSHDMPPGITQLFLPYLPYARQDRVAVRGDPRPLSFLSLQLVLSGISTVYSLDVHSNAATETFYSSSGLKLVSVSPFPYIQAYVSHLQSKGVEDFYLVSPDKGALPKTAEYARMFSSLGHRGFLGYAECEKIRDPTTGRLTQAAVLQFHPADSASAPVPGLPAPPTPIVVDDICDGGRTFINLAAALEYAGATVKPHLWTTHAIYSNGIEGLLQKFETLGSTDSWLHTFIASPREGLVTFPVLP